MIFLPRVCGHGLRLIDQLAGKARTLVDGSAEFQIIISVPMGRLDHPRK
jgi:hypothetical protein